MRGTMQELGELVVWASASGGQEGQWRTMTTADLKHLSSGDRHSTAYSTLGMSACSVPLIHG
jgi:hypothetical protein